MPTSDPTLIDQHWSEGLILTKNKMGMMVESMQEYDRLFIEHVRSSPKVLKVADLGVAYGYTSKELLKAGAMVTANDLSD